MVVICNYCGHEAKLATGKTVYPHLPALRKKKYWLCEDCNAYVGCHGTTNKPFGKLANKETRKWRMRAHAELDCIWKFEGVSRSEAYRWLAHEMNLSSEDCHIGHFDVGQCRVVIELCSSRTKKQEELF